MSQFETWRRTARQIRSEVDEELATHVHTLPEQPDFIPYRTAYFAKTWGFCVPHRLWQTMTDPHYRVVIDSTLAPGALTYGELLVPGQREDEVLISAHCCHPSLANDNLSGIAVAAELARGDVDVLVGHPDAGDGDPQPAVARETLVQAPEVVRQLLDRARQREVFAL